MRCVIWQLPVVAGHRRMSGVRGRTARHEVVDGAVIEQLRDDNGGPEPERENKPERAAERGRHCIRSRTALTRSGEMSTLLAENTLSQRALV